MFSKFMKFFEVKPDETLDYMDPDKLLKNKKRILKDPLNQEDEDEFFRQLEEENNVLEHQNVRPEPRIQPKNQPNRESVLEKMRQCMKERDWNPKHHPRIVIGAAAVLIGTVIMAIALHETPNPLIGKWQPQKKSNIFAPTGDIEFQKDKILANGISTPIQYTIEKQYVEVTDLNTKMRIPFYITNEKTIELNLLGIKTTYKKIEK
ncbi:hypothetical protein [Sulfurospirillum sp. UCH001]|uniref:hypothetical protein n=1 Tax=Sulfurospirillum sp. UCH001 TaxID=1581011 RepID=UPI0008354E13|nr:hypothetical protein [Sulfurospirillum sp. UCH001]